MQRAKLFGALFAYVNNIQITWKTIHLSVFYAGQTVPSTAQIRAEGNNKKCVGKKRFNGSVTHRLRKELIPFRIRSQSCFLMLPASESLINHA